MSVSALELLSPCSWLLMGGCALSSQISQLSIQPLNSSHNKVLKLVCQLGQGSGGVGHFALLLSGLLFPLEDMASYPRALQRTFCRDSHCLVLKY